MVWLVKRLKPQEGWGTFLLLLAIVLCLPGATLAADWVPRDEGLLPLALSALLIGRWLAGCEEWGWSVWLPVGGALGLLAALSVAGHVTLFLPGSGEATFAFAQRWVVWLRAATSGGSSEDPDIFLFYAALLCWVGVLLAAWAFYRRRRPLLALLPIAILSAVSVYYSGQGVLWLVGELGCGILLLAAGNLTTARRTWDVAGVDYSSDLGIEALAVAAPVAVIFVVVSLIGPMLSARRISDWFWRMFEEPSTEVEDTAGRLFGGVAPPQVPSDRIGTGPGASSYMPQSRLLGGRPTLLEEVVMTVWTDEPPPPPPEVVDEYIRPHERYEGPHVPLHYWRGATMDGYSGRGWATTVDSREEVEGELAVPAPITYREVTQRYEFTAPHGDTLYALNAPAEVKVPVEAVWRITPTEGEGGPVRPEGDLAGLASEVVSYTVVSRLPTPTADDLRAAPPLYSPEIVERYLQLPETLPERVVALAGEVAGEGQTVYERVRLLERYLRAYPYSLEVEQAPEGRDVTDYFLFDLREGYCDYYATAFVVMARAVGIPARLASGYVGGAYDYDAGAYVVRDLNGHSWPEVYFPGWGWIGFEPTGAQAVTELPEEMSLLERALPGPTGPPARVVRYRWRMAGLGVVVLGAVGVAVAVLVRRYRRRAVQAVTLPVVWGWVGQGGARLGLAPDPALTPREYSAMLATELQARAKKAGRWKARWTALAAQGEEELDNLAVLYSVQVYGGPPAAADLEAALGAGPPADEDVARHVWARLRGPLGWFRWLGWAQRVAREVGTRRLAPQR